MAHDVFLCHSSRDADVALRIVARLESAGIGCWIAPRNVVAGATYASQIIKAIPSSRVLVLLYSKDADGSPHVMRELEKALREGVTILPFRLDQHPPSEDLDYMIGSQHYIDASAPDLEPGEQLLVEHVRWRLAQIRPKVPVGEDSGAPLAAVQTGASERLRKRIDRLMDQAEFCESEGDWVGAVARYDEVLELAPEDSAVVRLRGVALRKVSGAEVKAAAVSRMGDEGRGTAASVQKAQESGGVRRLERVHAPAFPGFVRIEPGEFLMGSPDSDDEAFDNEKPQYRVRITRPFEMAVTPVTQDLYLAVMGRNPSEFKGNDRPVVMVSWFDAVAFCNALSRQEGLDEAYRITDTSVDWVRRSAGYCLPTEAEWEYACRAGTKNPRYGALDSVAWYDANSGGKPHAVGEGKPNAWGLFDMLGNVWEWVWDLKADYRSGGASDPAGPTVGDSRVKRGGSWFSDAKTVRAAYRRGSHPGLRTLDLGFRLSRSLTS